MYSDARGKTYGRNSRHQRASIATCRPRNLENFASAMQSHLSWSTGRVGDFESGRAAPNLTTLFAVTAALSDVVGRPVAIADLFAGEGDVAINDQLTVDFSALRPRSRGNRSTCHSPGPGR